MPSSEQQMADAMERVATALEYFMERDKVHEEVAEKVAETMAHANSNPLDLLAKEPEVDPLAVLGVNKEKIVDAAEQ